jgi:hypothetical protein
VLGTALAWDCLRLPSLGPSTTLDALMEHISLRFHNTSLEKSATPVSPSRPTFRYTGQCRAAIRPGKQAEEAGGSGDVFHAERAGTLASIPLPRNVGMARWCDRGNTPKHLLKEEEPLVELPVRFKEVDQHR